LFEWLLRREEAGLRGTTRSEGLGRGDDGIVHSKSLERGPALLGIYCPNMSPSKFSVAVAMVYALLSILLLFF
jgi:hypothetical protein